MAMDVPRGKEVARKRLIKRIATIVIAAIVIGGATIALARLKPAAPSVDMSGQWPGSVKRDLSKFRCAVSVASLRRKFIL